MQSLLNTVGSLINAAFVGGSGEGAQAAWVTTVVSCITSNPLLEVGFILSISGFAIGAIRRLCKLG